MSTKRILISLTLIITFYCGACQTQKDNNSSDNKTSFSDDTSRSTYKLLQGVWIDDIDSTNNQVMIIHQDSVYFSYKNNIVSRDRFYISKKFVDNKNQLSIKTKNGGYFVIYSSFMNDIDRCAKIDTLTKNKLILFLEDFGKHGAYEHYHR